MIISIASGKGGTGKTTVATNLAVSLNQPVQLLDCDVEAPNAHLFIHPAIQRSAPVNAPVPQWVPEKCSFCKKCMEICRFGALAVLKKDVMVFENLCHSCGGCFEVCPENALIEKERHIGVVETGSSGKLLFAHGRLNIGQVMVPPVIREVRATTDPEIITIIDAPPGTSCPVIAAVNQADVVVLVTEPTPFGLHDLKLAVETVQVLDIPFGLVINRAGMGNDEVKDFATENQIPVLMEIPFEKQFARIYSTGGLIAEEIDGYKDKFQRLFTDLKALAGRGQGVK